jgi:trimethylamine--corrinoid protein Co-methyltransferase
MGKLKLKILDGEQCQKIFDGAVRILNKTGVQIKNGRAKNLLAEAGCSIKGDLVTFPSGCIEDAVKTVPHDVIIFNKYGEAAAELNAGGGDTYFGPGMCNIYRNDVNTGKRRLAVKQDLFEAGLVVEALENFTFSAGLGSSSDCRPELAIACEVQQLLLSTSKPIFTAGGASLTEQRVIIDLCAAAAGGMDNLRKKPNLISGAAVSGPLVHSAENLESLLYAFDVGVPAIYSASPMIGATSPATIAGTLAVAMADDLVGLVLSQCVRKGNPYIGVGFIDFMDVRTTAFAHTTPEMTLGTIAMSDIFHFLGIPCLCHCGSTDSAIFDQECAFDYTSQLYSGLLAGADVCAFSGFIESAMNSSLEALVFADETIGHLRHIVSGIEINDETLALDLIDELKPGGNYLETEHTVEHYPEHWKPGLFVRQNWDAWSESGSKDCGARANEKVRSIIAAGVKKPVSETLAKDLDEIIKKAEAELSAGQ